MHESMIEFVIEWIKGAETATVTAPSSTALCNSMKRMKEKHPDKVTEFIQNKDGSICCHVPIEWVSVRPPKRINYSEEEKIKRAERMKEMRARQSIDKNSPKTDLNPFRVEI